MMCEFVQHLNWSQYRDKAETIISINKKLKSSLDLTILRLLDDIGF